MKAVIIGAGPAGLTAAYKILKETDIKPVIYEESSVVGGISQTFNYKNNRMDLGGHRFFTKNEEVMSIWKELMRPQGKPSKDDILLNRKRDFEGDADPEVEDDVLLKRTRVSRIFYLRKFFDYPISLKPRTFINMGFVRTCKSGFGYMKSSVFKRKENSLEDFYINRFGKSLYSLFFEDYTEKLWGRHPSVISPDWGSQRVKGLSLSKAIIQAIKKPFVKKSSNVETSLIEEFFYPKKGPGQLYEKMAKCIVEMGGEIIYNASVKNIHLVDNNVSSVDILIDGEMKSVSGDYYISSMPLKDLFLGIDNAPSDVKEIATTLPYRDFMTVGLLLKELSIKNKTKMETYNNIVPDCWIYVQERDVKMGRIQIFNNWSPYMVDDFKNTIFIGLEYFCDEGDSYWNMPDDEFIEFATNELVKIGVIDKSNVIDGVRLRVKKAYPAYFDSYKNIGTVQKFIDGVGNLYCIGRNGQHRYNNMDHSMLTAIEAVNAICGKVSKDILWDVNTEKEYHEEKK